VNLFQIVILFGLLGNTALGLFVLFSNPRRSANIGFFILTFLMMLWMGAMYFCSFEHSELILLFWIRQTSAFAGLIPIGVFILQLAIEHPDITVSRILYELRYWLLACLSIVVLCHTSIFALSARNPTDIELVPPTEYGWGFWIYITFFVVAIITFSIGFRRVAKSREGAKRSEIQFLQIGCIASFIIGVFLIASAEITENQEISLFVPLSVLALDGFVAYGIATRRILAASAVLQRVVAYVLMSCYLVGLYSLSVWFGRYVFQWFFTDPSYVSYLLATLVVAFSVVPAHGWMQAFVHRLFPHATSVNVDEVLKKAGHIFQEVSTEDHLTILFSELIVETFGVTQLILLRPDKDGSYDQYYASPEQGRNVSIRKESPLIQLLTLEHEAFTTDMLQRMRSSPLVDDAREELESLGAAAILGSFMRKEMKAIVLLSQKESGRIYDLHDQRALQLLCDQFAVALENASLYTAVQNGKIYNDILLDSLTSGIIAVNADRMVTVFNQCAQVQIGLSESAVIDQAMTVLPPALVECLETVLRTQVGFRDKDMYIKSGDEDIPIRVSGAIFHGHTGNLLGALLAFNDMTLLKKLEEQIRRTDRLSSIGTLSAGMAHEIKNPLVTIKTFTQLLPQQYSDTEFRHTFFDLVGQEVKRIDTIVNRLLNFARPAKASLKPVSLHDVIDNSLRLAEQQLAQHGIALERHLDAVRHVIEADAEQLNQTFVNFFLNAVHAMKKGGKLAVRTSIVQFSPDDPLAGSLPNVDRIQVDVQDTGCGIAPEALSKIFDPFFTTKEDGIGLGLSVSHGIIQEHMGTIDVESQEGVGTVFHVQFPLLTPQEEKEE
jgi:signal transduction histidine kinase